MATLQIMKLDAAKRQTQSIISARVTSIKCERRKDMQLCREDPFLGTSGFFSYISLEGTTPERNQLKQGYQIQLLSRPDVDHRAPHWMNSDLVLVVGWVAVVTCPSLPPTTTCISSGAPSPGIWWQALPWLTPPLNCWLLQKPHTPSEMALLASSDP